MNGTQVKKLYRESMSEVTEFLAAVEKRTILKTFCSDVIAPNEL